MTAAPAPPSLPRDPGAGPGRGPRSTPDHPREHDWSAWRERSRSGQPGAPVVAIVRYCLDCEAEQTKRRR